MNKTQAILILLLAMIMTGCKDKKEKDTAIAPVPVKVLSVQRGDPASGNTYVGTVEEVTGTQLSFEVPGNIRSLRVDAGDKVHKGQVLGTVDASTLKEAYQAQHAQAQQARDAYRRFSKLHKEGTVADVKMVEIESKLQQAVAAEKMAAEQVGKTTLYAPFSGVISEKPGEVGMNVLPGQPVLKLVTLDKVSVKIPVPEAEISSIRLGQSMRFTVSALGGKVFQGIVTEKGVAADPLSHTYNVKITLTNPGGQLMPGMVCSVEHKAVNHSTVASTAIVIPFQCVQIDEQNRRFVWIVNGGKAEQRFITTGDYTDNGVVVLSGLSAGDNLITDGSQKVCNGTKVVMK